MNWFKDMIMLFGEWLLWMIIPLLLGILIGWLIWGGRNKKDKESEDKAQAETKSARPDVEDDLSAVKGIDGDTEASLKEKGVKSYYDLATLSNEDVDKLETEFGYEGDKIRNENWVSQAAQLHFENYGEEIYDDVKVDAVYADEFEKQLAETKKGMVFDYTDDLKQISGVGPKMEKLLQDFGITTFYHLSKLNKEGVNALNDKLEFFPGRIERDDWIGQAKELHKKLHE